MSAQRQVEGIKRRARGKRTQDAVLDSAARTIRRGGIAGLNVGAVMRDAGKTVGGFYNPFSSKDALAEAAVRRLLDLPLQLFAHCATGHDPVGGVVAYVDYYLSPAHCDEPLRGCPLPGLVSDLPRMAPEVRACADAAMANVASAIAAKLALGGVTPRLGIGGALTEMIGSLALARVTADPELAVAILSDARASVLDKLGLAESAMSDPAQVVVGAAQGVARTQPPRSHPRARTQPHPAGASRSRLTEHKSHKGAKAEDEPGHHL